MKGIFVTKLSIPSYNYGLCKILSYALIKSCNSKSDNEVANDVRSRTKSNNVIYVPTFLNYV